MLRVFAFETCDGRLHATHTAAVNHAQLKYDNAMTHLRQGLTTSAGLTVRDAVRAAEFIERSFVAIGEIHSLKIDCAALSDSPPVSDAIREQD